MTRYELTARGRFVLSLLGIVLLVVCARPAFELTQVLVAVALPLLGLLLAYRVIRGRVRR